MFSSLFITAFLAATILPAQSEAVLAYHIASDKDQIYAAILVATAGNVLGAIVNWWLGKYLNQFQSRRWFPIGPEKLDKARIHYARYGRYSLLLSWVPIIGDPITMIAGCLREPFWSFCLLVTIAKGARYLVVAGLVLPFT